MKSNINISPLRTWSQIPKSWEARPNVIHYDQRTDLHFEDGWRDIVNPVIGANQRRGELMRDEVNEIVTYEVIDLTPEEIEERDRNIALSNAQSARQEALQKEQERLIMDQKQSIIDDAEALENQAFFPLWRDFEDGHTFTVNTKVQDFEGVEMKLWRVLQEHNKQSDWFPSNVPALFVKVLADGAPLIWEAGIQVTVGEEYLYQPNGNTYIVIQSHTTQLGWEPPNVPSLWQLKV